MKLKSYISWNIYFFRLDLFFVLGKFLSEIQKKYEARNFQFWKYKNCCNLRARNFHFLKYKSCNKYKLHPFSHWSDDQLGASYNHLIKAIIFVNVIQESSWYAHYVKLTHCNKTLQFSENYGKGCYFHFSDMQKDCYLAWFQVPGFPRYHLTAESND